VLSKVCQLLEIKAHPLAATNTVPKPTKGIPMIKNILIPTDGTEFSQKAIATGVELAKGLGAKVTAYFAAPPATPIIYRNHLPVGYSQPSDHQRMIDETTRKALEVVEQAARAAGVEFEAHHSTSDFPDDEILKIAARRKCDLIVMATHGQSGLRGILIGSVTQRVLNKSTIPVMVVR
jgi:nucleotide-binding universal stress UspA family protein